jgi:hypothetical protein
MPHRRKYILFFIFIHYLVYPNVTLRLEATVWSFKSKAFVKCKSTAKKELQVAHQ